MATHPFLARLQLDNGADARAIRRAYARELKLIDQEAEPAAFQHLRECYERALAWAEHVAREDAAAAGVAPDGVQTSGLTAEPVPEPAREAAPAAGGHTQSDPVVQARLVLDEFCDLIPALLARPGEVRLEPWVQALSQAASDRRLEHLEARACFEGALARLLANGWRPGHEVLFPAAVKVFGWDADRRALECLAAGQVLDAALDELAAFHAQDIQARTGQRALLALLRKPDPPPEQTMWKQAARLHTIAAQFPHLIVIVAPRNAIEHWLAHCPEPAYGPEAPDQPQLDMGTRATNPHWGQRIFMILALWYTFTHIFAGSGDHRSAPPQLDPDIARVMKQQPRPVPPLQEQPLTRAQYDAIAKHLHYQPTPGTPPGVQETRVEIYLDDDGNMVGVKWLKRSSDPAFGAAVEKAVHDSGPFPRSVARVFEIGVRTTRPGGST